MRTLEELPSRWRRPEALHRGPKLRASSRAPRAPRSPACGAPGPTSGLQRTGRLAAAVPCLAGSRTSPVVRGRAGADAGRSSAAGGRGGGSGPESRVRMAADGSGPYLGSPTPATRHVLPASAPLIPALGGGTPGLPLKQDGCAFVQTAQEIPLQVDMAVALQRLRVAEKYGKSYLCLLQAVFVAGRCPPARAPPGGPGSSLAGSRAPLTRSLPSPPGRRAHFVFPHPPRTHTRPRCGGAPSSCCSAACRRTTGCASLRSGRRAHREKVRAMG